MTQLCVDARWLQSGIGTHTFNLLRELGTRPELEVHALTYRQHQIAVEPFCRTVRIVGAPIYSIAEQYAVTEAARGFQLLHVPHYNVPLARKGTLLVTIHDLTHVVYPGYRKSWKSWGYAQPMLRLAARKAAHVFSVSEYSKRKIVEHLGVPAEKVTVAAAGVRPNCFCESRVEARDKMRKFCGVEKPYILNVGSYRPHKNTEGLLRAFARLRHNAALDLELVLLGEFATGRKDTIALAAELGISESTRIVGRVSDDVLRAAYCAAELTVVPSFEEGFGLPVLESMACGTPVICSRAASLPEVASDAAEYFNPYDIESMASAIERVLLSNDLRDQYTRKGLKRAKQFTWKAVADRHLEIYKQYFSPPN